MNCDDDRSMINFDCTLNKCVFTEHPYETRLTKTDWNYVHQFKGKYDGEAANVGFYDKMEVEAVRRFLWKAGELSMVPVSKI